MKRIFSLWLVYFIHELWPNSHYLFKNFVDIFFNCKQISLDTFLVKELNRRSLSLLLYKLRSLSQNWNFFFQFPKKMVKKKICDLISHLLFVRFLLLFVVFKWLHIDLLVSLWRDQIRRAVQVILVYLFDCFCHFTISWAQWMSSGLDFAKFEWLSIWERRCDNWLWFITLRRGMSNYSSLVCSFTKTWLMLYQLRFRLLIFYLYCSLVWRWAEEKGNLVLGFRWKWLL